MKIGIAGAGAAGMIAAVAAAGAGADVFVVEHSSRPGMKLNITGLKWISCICCFR